MRQRQRRPSFPAAFSSATTLGYEGLPSTLITLGRGWPGERKACWKKPLRRPPRHGGRRAEINRSAGGIDSAVQVNPLALRPNVGLVHAPKNRWWALTPEGIVCSIQARSAEPNAIRWCGRRGCPLGEEFLDVPIGKGESQIPAHRTRNDSRFGMAPFKQGWPGFTHQGIISGSRKPLFQLCNTSRRTGF